MSPNITLNNFVDWEDPNADNLILGVISQNCRLEK